MNTVYPPISLCPYKGQGRSLKSIGPPRPASASSRLMMIDMAASSLPCSLLCPVSFSVDSCSAMTPSIRLVSAEVLATDPATKVPRKVSDLVRYTAWFYMLYPLAIFSISKTNIKHYFVYWIFQHQSYNNNLVQKIWNISWILCNHQIFYNNSFIKGIFFIKYEKYFPLFLEDWPVEVDWVGTVKPFFLVTATWLAKVAATSLDTATTSVGVATGGSDRGTTIKTQFVYK